MKEYTLIKHSWIGNYEKDEIIMVTKDKDIAFETMYKTIGNNPLYPYERFYNSVNRISKYCIPLFLESFTEWNTKIGLLTKEVEI